MIHSEINLNLIWPKYRNYPINHVMTIQFMILYCTKYMLLIVYILYVNQWMSLLKFLPSILGQDIANLKCVIPVRSSIENDLGTF